MKDLARRFETCSSQDGRFKLSAQDHAMRVSVCSLTKNHRLECSQYDVVVQP